MSKLSEMFDPEVVASILGEAEKNKGGKPTTAAVKTNPFESIEQASIAAGEGEMSFSKVFGFTPKTIPDIAITIFKDSDWDEPARPYIPDVDENWVWNQDVLELIAIAVYCGDTTLLYGLQGTGKTCAIQQYAAVCRIPFWRQSCNRETRETHFLGSPSIEYNEEGNPIIKQEPTMLTESLKFGGIFCEDEAFRHNSALVLQPLREKSTRTITLPDAPGRTAEDRILKAPEGRWWYFLTDNTTGTGDETGTFEAEVQDASTLDRIDVAIEVPYLEKGEEVNILKGHSSLDDKVIDGMVTFAGNVRNAFGQQQLMATISVRGLMAWAEKTELTGDIGCALKMSWYNKLNSDDKATVKDMFHQVFEVKL